MISWPQVALLFIYVTGAVVAVVVGSEPIAYMLAGAAANAGMIQTVTGKMNGRSQKNSIPPS